jgi:serine protease AprX
MKIPVLLLSFICLVHINATAGNKYIIYFADKGNAQYKAADISAALTPVAIEKRQQNGLGFDHYDIAVNAAYLQELQNNNINIIHTSRWLNAALIETDLNASAIKAASKHISKIVALHPKPNTNNKFSAELGSVNKSANTANRTNASLNYGDASAQNLLYGIDYLHDKGYTGKGILVAFLDAGYNGFDLNPGFDSVRARNGIKATFDFWDTLPNVYHKDFHGAFCAAYMLGNIPGQYIGMAPAVDVMLGITDDQVTETHQDEFNYIAGVEWAEAQGADIISASISYREFDPGEGDYDIDDMDGKTSIVSQGARLAAAKGIIVVNAAGNGGIICTPCDVDSILCVGGAMNDKTYDGISSFGPTKDGRVKPDVAAQTINIFSLNTDGSSLNSFYGGTSSATPQMAGLAACLKQANPKANNYQIIQAIRKSAHNYDFPDNNTGYGVPNAKVADDTLRIMLAVPELQSTISFNLYPNPATTTVYVESKEAIQSVTIISMTGQLIQSMQPNTPVAVLDLGNMATGNYIVYVQTAKGKTSSILNKL